ncbi:MAG: ABC transporter permease [Anaerolineaceae bacterium]|jgi:ABC-2 type transport system permease protein
MKKFWLVASHEYLRQVMRRRFLFALLSFPFFGLLMVGVIYLEFAAQSNYTPIGYVADPQVFPNFQTPLPDPTSMFSPVKIITFNTEADARTALDAKQIQVYYVLDPNYMQNGQVHAVSLTPPGDNAKSNFERALRYNLLQNTPADIADRLVAGSNIIVRTPDGSREMQLNNYMTIILPLLAGILFMIAINTSGGYLMHAVVEEKENRTMEVIVTSISPNQLIAAKTIGNLAVGLTQLIIWILFVLVLLPIVKYFIPSLGNMGVDPTSILLMAAVFLPAFVMVGALMAAVGATATESREAQQIAGLFSLPIVIPYWFISPIMLSPNSPLAIGLSLFPLTAPVTLPLRAAFTTVPIWQILTSIGLLIVCALGALWIAGRAFRLGMLRYGKRLALKEIFSRAKA